METITMNLPIEVQVAKRIKKYAKTHKTSVSSIAENFFAAVTSAKKEKNMEVSPLVQSFSLNDINIPDGFDYKTELANARNEKYLR